MAQGREHPVALFDAVQNAAAHTVEGLGRLAYFAAAFFGKFLRCFRAFAELFRADSQFFELPCLAVEQAEHDKEKDEEFRKENAVLELFLPQGGGAVPRYAEPVSVVELYGELHALLFSVPHEARMERRGGGHAGR